MTAIGRPEALNVSSPSTRTTESFSPRMLTCIASSGITIETGSLPVGATALRPLAPLPPVIRSTRSAWVRNSFCTIARETSVLSSVSTPIVAV